MQSKLLSLLAALAFALPLSGQGAGMMAEQTVDWTVGSEEISPDVYRVTLTGTILPGYHIYDTHDKYSGTELTLSGSGFIAGELQEAEPATEEGEFYGRAVFYFDVTMDSADPVTLEGSVIWTACRDQVCGFPEEFAFTLDFTPSGAAPARAAFTLPEQDSSAGGDGSLWSLLIEAILCGLLMLLTPCVFPMVPMTVSYFLKGSASPAAARFKALMYGVFIVVLYTLPIAILILVTWLAGGDDTTADIFNWFSTHWIPNILFFIVFIVFAISFFGAFEIMAPSSLVNKSDRKSDQGGLGGIFFMALTLVLVSFSCTVPIVGTVLIQSVRGAFWTPILTMLVFSLAFALPFTLLALSREDPLRP